MSFSCFCGCKPSATEMAADGEHRINEVPGFAGAKSEPNDFADELHFPNQVVCDCELDRRIDR